MSIESPKTAALRAVAMGLFPTMNSLQEVMDYAESRIPISSKNELTGILMMYHNTLLKIRHEEATKHSNNKTVHLF